MSGFVSSVEGELNAVVKEFLEYLQLTKTVAIFEEECRTLGKPIQDQAGASRKDERITKIVAQLLEHFDNGQRTEFFSEWETHVDSEYKKNNLACQKLDFNLQLHFAILPIRKIDHWSKEEVEEAMVYFHYYLESKGSVLSDCPEFLPYYALPYIPRPHNHPTFTEIFKDSWMKKLRCELKEFLFEGLKSKDDMKEPRLIELYHHRDLDLQDAKKELQYLEKHLEESEKRSVLNAKKCEKLQEECCQLMAVASLLVTALENAVKGNLVDMDCVLSACTTHLPDLGKLRNESPHFMSTIKESNIHDDTNDKVESKLNYEAMKEDLRAGDNHKKALLFQALRWRLTKVQNWSKREVAVMEFVDNDILDLHTTSDNPVKIFMCVRTMDKPLLETFMRYLNAFASFVLGRQYLTSNTKLLELMVEHLLTSDAKEDIIIDMILGTLKKMSIRRISQAYMVEGGVIEWLAAAFYSKAAISNYALHSAVSLLFNLSLCPMGKKRCEPLNVELISGLGELLQLQDVKISPYVNGILYRILSIPSVKEYAKEQALPNALQKIMIKAEGEPKKQLETILELFVTDVQIEDGSSDEEDEDQENDNLEPEIDVDDKVKANSNEAMGEDLLQLYYGDKCDFPFNSYNTEEVIDTSDIHRVIQNEIAENDVSAKLSSVLNIEIPVTPKLDIEATQLVRKIVGMPSTTLVEAAVVPDPAAVTIKGLNANEYTVAFSSRPKIPRTPEPGEAASPKREKSSPLHQMHRDFTSVSSSQGIYCN